MASESPIIRTQETYQFNNSTVFYSLVNSAFYPYYQNVIRVCQQWLDGFVPSFHKPEQGIVSSRIAAKLMNGFKTSIFGRGLIFSKGRANADKNNETLDFISHKWLDKSNLQNAVNQLIGYTLSLGTGALKLNKSSDGLLWVEALRLDYFYFSVSSKNEVLDFKSFIRAFDSVEDKEQNYFLVEHRFFKEVKEPFYEEINGKKIRYSRNALKPYVRYEVYEYQGTVNNNTMPAANKGVGKSYKQLPDAVKRTLKQEYGALKLDEDILLPFNNYLGVEIFKNEGGDITNPSLPFGRPLIADCIADFAEYDLDKSYSIRDLYNSKGVVGVPRSLNQKQLTAVPGTGNNLHHIETPLNSCNIPSFEYVDGLDPQTQKPIISQFEIRAQEHELKQMAILKSIAVTVGVSPRAIASFLVQSGEKTDDQIQSEDDTITQWIKTHRQDYVLGINKIIETVLNQNGYENNIEVKFASDGLLKGDKQLESIKARMELGMLTLEDAIREYYPDLDEMQLRDKIKKAYKQQAEKQQQQMAELDEFYGDDLANGKQNNQLKDKSNELDLPE